MVPPPGLGRRSEARRLPRPPPPVGRPRGGGDRTEAGPAGEGQAARVGELRRDRQAVELGGGAGEGGGLMWP